MSHHLWVWRAKRGEPNEGMWKGTCSCGWDRSQYWNWGAALGAALHHFWKAGH